MRGKIYQMFFFAACEEKSHCSMCSSLSCRVVLDISGGCTEASKPTDFTMVQILDELSRSKITLFSPFTKLLSVTSMLHILLSKNLEWNILACESHRAIIQKALWVLWQKARERNDTVEQPEQLRDTKCQKCNRAGVSGAIVALWINYFCEKTFV